MRALVTGASGEIGTAICLELAKNGIEIIGQYNSNYPENLECKLRSIGVKFSFVQFDFGKDDVDSFSETDVDILVNNAGISIVDVFQGVSFSDVDRILDVNLGSAMKLSAKCVPSMLKKRFGRIVNISSIWGVDGASCEVHYSATKAGLIGFTKSLSKEVGISGITVNCVAPGFVETKMNAHLSEEEKQAFLEETSLGRAINPQEVAKTVAFLCSESASAINGQTIVLG